MKKRIITGVLAALFAISLLVMIGLGYIKYLSFIAAVFSAIAAYEIMRVSKCKNKVLTGLSCAVSAYVPFHIAFDLGQYIPLSTGNLLAILVIVMLLIMLKWYDKTRFEHVTLALFGSIAIPWSIMTIYKLDELCSAYPELFQRSHIVFILLCAMYAAWISDTCAYFVGSKLGKRKLAPRISPKKSVEGAIGGVTGVIIICIITFIICKFTCFPNSDTIKLWMVIPASAAISIIGMFGDLSASVIKRNFNEKDFGNLFPGHGGVLDRIDSFLFAMPATYLMMSIILAFVG